MGGVGEDGRQESAAVHGSLGGVAGGVLQGIGKLVVFELGAIETVASVFTKLEKAAV